MLLDKHMQQGSWYTDHDLLCSIIAILLEATDMMHVLCGTICSCRYTTLLALMRHKRQGSFAHDFCIGESQVQ